MFQSTRPRGTRPIFLRDTIALSLVSIHASARDATNFYIGSITYYGCFNPRVREGRDLLYSCCIHYHTSFNPRVREGRDVDSHRPDGYLCVSIHASARDATSGTGSCTKQIRCFNPRVREGRDYTAGNETVLPLSFNPRVREGRDIHDRAKSADTKSVSIHASARDATHADAVRDMTPSFNPRVREGRDAMALAGITGQMSFNPRVREGRDSLTASSLTARSAFQSTRPRGTRQGTQQTETSRRVSIHASARDAT